MQETDTELEEFNFIAPNITEEYLKSRSILALSNNYQQQKELNYQRMLILVGMSDPDKAKLLYEIVDKLHEGILDIDGELPYVIDVCLGNDKEVLKFFQQYKHGSFTKGISLLDKYKDHPVQKQVVKHKNLGRRLLKKQKTAHQHVACVHSAKQQTQMQLEIEELKHKQRIQELKNEARFRLLESSLVNLGQVVNSNAEITLDLIDELEGKGLSPKKVLMYKAKLNNPDLRNNDLAEVFGVTTRTVIRWTKDVEEVLQS